MNNNINNEGKKYGLGPLTTTVVISLIFGGLMGGVAGFVSSSLLNGSFSGWLANPLGIIKSGNQERFNANQNLFQPQTAEEQLTTQAVKKVSPAVVSIVITKELQQYYNYSGPGFPFDDFFGLPFDFLNQNRPLPGPTEKREVGGGTGFIITADGLILTNKHVINDEQAEYSVILNDASRYDAKVVAKDPLNDLAFLKIEAKGLPTVELGDSEQIQIGQTVLAIGYALGQYSNTVTKGIISGTGRDIVAGSSGVSEKLEDVIQTDTAINPGNSGGPLIDLRGQVIGINTAINLQGQLISFAIPVNSAKPLIDSVKENGRIIRPYLGVRYVILNEQVAKENNLHVNYGALLVGNNNSAEPAVIPGGPADKAGLAESDVILEISGVKIDSEHSLAEEVAKYLPGDKIKLKVLHAGEEKEVAVELGEFK